VYRLVFGLLHVSPLACSLACNAEDATAPIDRKPADDIVPRPVLDAAPVDHPSGDASPPFPATPTRDASAATSERFEEAGAAHVGLPDAMSGGDQPAALGGSKADSGMSAALPDAGAHSTADATAEPLPGSDEDAALGAKHDAGSAPNESVVDAASIACPEIPELSSTDQVSKSAHFLFYDMRVNQRFYGIVDWSMYTQASFAVSINRASGTSTSTRECVETTVGVCTRSECTDGPVVLPEPSDDESHYIPLPVAEVSMTGLAVDPLPMPPDATFGQPYDYVGRNSASLWSGGETAHIHVNGACGVPDFELDFEVPNRAEFTSHYFSASGTASPIETGRDLEVTWEPGPGEVHISLSQTGPPFVSVQCIVEASEGGVVVDATLFEDFAQRGSLSIGTNGSSSGMQDDWKYSIRAQSYYSGPVEWTAPTASSAAVTAD
jgi:hypothetical protein